MSPLLSILRAAHCRNTHHYFAIDALRMVQTDAGLRLRDILLKHHEKYLTGAKDPDTRFRDFQNHVIHVQDGYFGGAPRLAMKWYDRMMGHLVSSKWEDAAYAMGVLSHYFTDPLMPLHTAQSEREALVHRPMEWSVCKSYDRILKRWTDNELRLVFQLGDGDGWLGEAILKGARFANRSYKRLVEGYNIDLGAENPAAGIDQEAIDTFAELFGLAITGLARIVERAAYETETRCGEPMPKVGLTMPAILATLQIPEQLWLRRIVNCEERKAIEAIVTEYRVTGKVVKNMPGEVFIKQAVMKVREREAQWNAARRERALATGAQAARITASEITATATTTDQPQTLESIAESMPQQEPSTVTTAAEQTALPQSETSEVVSIPFLSRQTVVPSQEAPAEQPTTAIFRRISRENDLVDAPAIGPKVAEAFAAIKIFKIGEFIDTPAAAMARRLQKSWITPATIEDWQAQTRLMCEVPGLLSLDAQILVGVGCSTVEMLATSNAARLVAVMNRFATSPEGLRLLRGVSPATTDQVAKWIASATIVHSQGKAA